jgi:hypothetical protein
MCAGHRASEGGGALASAANETWTVFRKKCNLGVPCRQVKMARAK